MGIYKGLKHMRVHEGFKSLFKGNGVNLLVQAPFTSFEFFFYEFYKNNLFPSVTRENLTYKQKMACGGLTGMTATFLLYPLDVIRTFVTIS